MADDSTRSLDVDPQDPLPESTFLFRRITTWVVGLSVLALIWHNVEALHQIGNGDGLVLVSQYLIALLALILTYYLIAPSAEHVTRMIQTGAALRSGVIFSSARRVEAGDLAHETKTRTGVPAPPAAAANETDIME